MSNFVEGVFGKGSRQYSIQAKQLTFDEIKDLMKVMLFTFAATGGIDDKDLGQLHPDVAEGDIRKAMEETLNEFDDDACNKVEFQNSINEQIETNKRVKQKAIKMYQDRLNAEGKDPDGRYPSDKKISDPN